MRPRRCSGGLTSSVLSIFKFLYSENIFNNDNEKCENIFLLKIRVAWMPMSSEPFVCFGSET